MQEFSIWEDVRKHEWKYRSRTRPITGIIWHATRGSQYYDGLTEMRAAINWFKSPNNRIEYAGGDYAGISNYLVGPGTIVEVVPPDYCPAWSSYPADLVCISVEVCQSNYYQPIEPQTIDACIALAERLESQYGISRERVFPVRDGMPDDAVFGHVGHADTRQGYAQGKTDPDDKFWEPFMKKRGEDEMTPEERELLLKIATVVAGHRTGLDFQNVSEALQRFRQLAMEDAIILQGLAEFQNAFATHTHDVNGNPVWQKKIF